MSILAATWTPTEAEYLANLGDLWGRGWSVIPLRWGTKIPAIPSWTAYQQQAATYDQLQYWFDRPTRFNVGVVTGVASGVFVIDCDSPEALAWASEHLPVCAMRVRTAKGMHLYYPYSGDRPMRNQVRTRFAGVELALDVRAQGGYVVGPGSLHPSGHVYTREGSGWS